MNWKVLLSVVALVGIGLLLMQTDSGRDYMSSASSFLGSKVGNFVADFGKQAPVGTAFTVSLNTERKPFLGKTFEVDNASLRAEGLCATPVKAGSVVLHVEANACTVEVAGGTGTFAYTSGETVKFEGEAYEVVTNGNKATPDDPTGKGGRKFAVSFEVAATKFLLSNLAQDKIELAGVKGGLDRMAADGTTVKSHEELQDENLAFGPFNGYLKLENSNINMRGTTYSVKGTDAHSSFTW